MRKQKFFELSLWFSLAWAGPSLLAGCSADRLNDGLTAGFDYLSDNVGQQPAEAEGPEGASGLNLMAQPRRGAESADWLPNSYGYKPAPLLDWQLNKLEFDVRLPQSPEAIEGFLGIPFAKDGAWHYWQITNEIGGIAGTELAIRYAHGKAVEYTYVPAQ